MIWIDSRIEDPYKRLSERKGSVQTSVSESVANIIDDVRRRGDLALLEQARRFDSPVLDSIVVTDAELEGAEVSKDLEEALVVAIDRVMRFHEAQLYYLTDNMDAEEFAPSRFDGVQRTRYIWKEETDHGGYLGQRLVPLDSVGVYAPGGKASYPSSVVMNVCPANVAMVGNVILTTPARQDGTLHPATLVAARHCFASKVIKIGGASAVAALALGTESVPKVDKVVGPGNSFVNEAKRQLWGTIGVDGMAGPSEVCVLADRTTNAKFAAADLLTQIEHSEDNLGYLVCSDEAKAKEICDEIESQTLVASRADVLRQAIQNTMIIVTKDDAESFDLVNTIAPEHLSIALENQESALNHIHNAGAILVGEYSAESAGDYVAGPSHTLPTGTTARFGSPLNVMDFFKFQSLVCLDEGDLRDLQATIDALAKAEGFSTHARGATIRFER